MLSAITTIFLMTLTQIVVGNLWYSKILFGNQFIELSKIDLSKLSKHSIRFSYIKAIISALLKSVVIYMISYDMYLLQAVYVFKIVTLMPLLTAIVMLDDIIWGNKSIKLYIIQASQVFVSLLAAFLVAFITYSFI